MSGGSRFLAVIGWLFVVAVGVWVLMVAAGEPPWAMEIPGQFLDTVESYPLTFRVVVAAAGGLLALLVLVLPFLGVRKAHEERPIEFTGEAGTMVIEVTALEEWLRRTVLEDEDVSDAACTIKVPEIGSEEPIICNLDVGIKVRPDVPGKVNELTVAVRDHFLEILPMDQPPNVNVKVRIQRPRPAATARFPAVKTAEKPLPEPEAPTEEFKPVDLPGISGEILPEAGPEEDEDADRPEEGPQEPSAGHFTGEMKYPVEDESREDEEQS